MKMKIVIPSILIALAGVFGVSTTRQTTPNYVNCTSGSNSNKGTESSPWQTVAYAVTNVNPSRKILVSGYCNERLVLPSNLTIARAYQDVPAILDGKNTGTYPATIEIWGQHDITIDGLIIRNSSNVPGNTVKGINITSDKGADDTWFTTDDRGSYNISLVDNVIEEVNKSTSTSYSLPLVINGDGDSSSKTLLSKGSPTHHISIVRNRFKESDTNSNLLGLPLIQVVNNVTDFEIRDNYFNDTSTNAIMLSGNRSDTALPNRPRKGVIVGNTFDTMGEAGVYITASQRILIEGNQFLDSTRGIAIYTENEGLNGDFDLASDIWIRYNTFQNMEQQSLATGAIWSSEYCDVANIYFTNNIVINRNKPNSIESISLYRDGAIDGQEATECLTTCGNSANECGEVTGDTKIVNNAIFTDSVTSSDSKILLDASDHTTWTDIAIDYNMWSAPSTSLPFQVGASQKSFYGFQTSTSQDLYSIMRDFSGDEEIEIDQSWLTHAKEPTPSWIDSEDFFGVYTP